MLIRNIEHISESRILKLVKGILDSNHVFYERLNAVMGNDVGKPDIVGYHHGLFFALELKSTIGRQRLGQKLFQKRMTAAGGQYYILRDISTVQMFCDDLELVNYIL